MSEIEKLHKLYILHEFFGRFDRIYEIFLKKMRKTSLADELIIVSFLNKTLKNDQNISENSKITLEYLNYYDYGLLSYALLYVLIEGFQEFNLNEYLEGMELDDDLLMKLKKCRNAIFHVSLTYPEDKRIREFIESPESASFIKSCRAKFSKLFYEEFICRLEG